MKIEGFLFLFFIFFLYISKKKLKYVKNKNFSNSARPVWGWKV